MKKLHVMVLLLFTNLAIAQVPDMTTSSNVNDFAHVLKPGQINALNEQILQIEKESNLQLVVFLINKLPEGMNVDDFTSYIDSKWQGHDTNINKDRLIYIAAIPTQRHKLIAIRGINSVVVFNNEKCNEILGNIKPYYRAKDYNGGLQTLVSNVASALQGAAPQTPPGHFSGLFIGVIIGIIVLIAFFAIKRNKKQAYL